MKPHSLSRPHGLPLAVLVLGLACGTAAFAEAALAEAALAEAEAPAPAPGRSVTSVELAPALPQSHGAARPRGIVIGSATEGLLAWQRDAAGARPRPIDGEQASRSYQRYLKSFETPIPEHYSTGLDLKKQ